MAPRCYVCNVAARSGMPVHLATAGHRRRTRPAVSPRGRHAYSSRRAATAAAWRAIRAEDARYDPPPDTPALSIMDARKEWWTL